MGQKFLFVVKCKSILDKSSKAQTSNFRNDIAQTLYQRCNKSNLIHPWSQQWGGLFHKRFLTFQNSVQISIELVIPFHTIRSLFQDKDHLSRYVDYPLQWRHNGHDGISNHQPYNCLLNRSFRHRSKKTSKLRVTSLCVGNSPGTGEFPAQMASNAENVSIWWRHHEMFWNFPPYHAHVIYYNFYLPRVKCNWSSPFFCRRGDWATISFKHWKKIRSWDPCLFPNLSPLTWQVTWPSLQTQVTCTVFYHFISYFKFTKVTFQVIWASR